MPSSHRPTLYIFSGLPATGKSTLAARLAAARCAVFVRIDTIEQALRDLCRIQVYGEGYRLAYRVAADNLRIGTDVVADSCNLVEITRREWEAVARDSEARYRNIEVICSDPGEHRQRVDTRRPTVPGLKLSTWDQVVAREREPWTVDRITVDTAGRSVDSAFADLVARLS